MRILALTLALTMLTTADTFAQAPADNMPKITEKNGRHQLLVDGKPFFVLGGQVHNSSAWPGMMPKVWAATEQMHLNTLEVPVYWEQVEPQQGKFDFSVVDLLLSQARQHHVRMVLLWFGTWKNGSNHYMPAWMKQDPARYPNITGKKGQPIDSPSPHSQATLDADIKAFTTVIRHLKSADPQHTVIMVQVENETGSWGSVRDYSPAAQKLFEEIVPAQMLKPELLKALNRPVDSKGNWKEVFGDRADEYFQAWSIASYVGKVAAAGKAVYALPYYVNAALRDPLTNPTAENYESGGPTDNVIPIWKIAAPAVDLEAPDIYLDGDEQISKVIDLYDRPDNALFVPETELNAEKAKYLFEVIAHGGIGFSPFGIDDSNNAETKEESDKHLRLFAEQYAVIAPMIPQLAQWGFEGKIRAVAEHRDHGNQTIDLGSWQAVISFGTGEREALKPNPAADGKLMMVQLGENKFIVIGDRCHIVFKPVGSNAGKAWQYLKVTEGSFENGLFKPMRILNGDETDWGGPHFGKSAILEISLIAR